MVAEETKIHLLGEMEVNEECVSSFLNELEDFVDFSRVSSQELANQSEQDVIQTLYTFANNTIYGEETRNRLALSVTPCEGDRSCVPS